MPWPEFLCTWGVVLFSSAFAVFGFISCKRRGYPISAFYIIFPLLLILVFLVLLNLEGIIDTILQHEPAA